MNPGVVTKLLDCQTIYTLQCCQIISGEVVTPPGLVNNFLKFSPKNMNKFGKKLHMSKKKPAYASFACLVKDFDI
jgi:hypothetical protein